jgi:hypothetical protein
MSGSYLAQSMYYDLDVSALRPPVSAPVIKRVTAISKRS